MVRGLLTSSILDAVAEQMAVSGASVAVLDRSTAVTYARLWNDVVELASDLRESGVADGDIVGVVGDTSAYATSIFLALLNIGAVFFPLNARWPLGRISSLLRDNDVEHVVAVSRGRCGFGDDFEIAQPLGDSMMICSRRRAGGVRSPKSEQVKAESIAYCMCTSGSSGVPKLAHVSNTALFHLVNALSAQVLQARRKLRIGLLAPLTFDPSIQQSVLALCGGHTLVIAPEECRYNPLELMDWMVQQELDVCDGTPSHLRLLASVKRRQGVKAAIHMLIGGEQLYYEDVALAAKALPFCAVTVTNLYGLTECAVDSFFHTVRAPVVASGPVPIGRPLGKTRFKLIDAPGGVNVGDGGELCLAGPGVPGAQTEGTSFCRSIAAPYQSDEFFRTGDLVRELPDGALEYLGRRDRQVKVNGVRIAPQEIESAIRSYVPGCASLCREHGDWVLDAFVSLDSSGQLCAQVVGEADAKALRTHLRTVLPESHIPSRITVSASLLLGENGKTGLPARTMSASHDTHAGAGRPPPENLSDIWSIVLGAIPSADEDFFNAGGCSLKVGLLLAHVQDYLGVSISYDDVIRNPTFRCLSRFIQNLKTNRDCPEHVGRIDHAGVASRSQQRLYALHQLAPNGRSLNLGLVMLVMKSYVPLKLEACLRALCDRHSNLRSGFSVQRGKLVRQLQPIDVAVEHYCDVDVRAARDSLCRPFDLARPPLLRVGACYSVGQSAFHLILDMHHIAGDGVSLRLVARDLLALYGGAVPSRRTGNFENYLEWELNLLRRERVFETLDTLACVYRTQRGIDVLRRFEAGEPVRRCVINLASGELVARRAAMFPSALSFYLAVMSVLFAGVARRSGLCVLTAVSGRDRGDWLDVVGPLVRVEPLLIRARESEPFESAYRWHCSKIRTPRNVDARETCVEALREQAVLLGLTVQNALGFRQDLCLLSHGAEVVPLNPVESPLFVDLNLDVAETSDTITLTFTCRSIHQQWLGDLPSRARSLLQGVLGASNGAGT